jgi:hypothetical protein
MARRALIPLALAAALAAAGPAAGAQYVAPAGSGALFLFSGHGWGHGVGMSQYGAYGYALHGSTYDQILAHYYLGTTLAPAPTTTIRVLLADRRKTLTLSSDRPFLVTDGLGTLHTLGTATLKLGPALQVAADGQPAAPLAPPLTFATARRSRSAARTAAGSSSTSSTGSCARSTSSRSSSTSTASSRRRCRRPGRPRR